MNRIFLIIALFVATSTYSQEQVVDRIIAIVGDQIMMESELAVRTNQLKQQGVDATNDLCLVFENLLKEKILLNQALIDSIAISDGEVSGELERRIRYFTQMMGGRDKLEEFYGKSVIEIKDEFRKDIRNQLLITRAQQQVSSDAAVSPAEVEAYFKAIPKDSVPVFNTVFQVGQIGYIPEASKLQDSLAKAKATKIRDRIINGEDFSTLAMLYSEDPGSATNGGDLGFQDRGTFVPEFEEAAYRIKKEEVSELVKTEYGYHILQGMERQGERVRVKHILISPKITRLEIGKAQSLLDSLKLQLDSANITFEKAVYKYSNDEATKPSGGILMNPATSTTFFESSQLDPRVYFEIEKLKEGQYSPAAFYSTPQGKQGVRILYLKSIDKQHRASLLTDYDKIKAMALAEKQAKVLEDWFKLKVIKNYVKIADAYINCSSLVNQSNIN